MITSTWGISKTPFQTDKLPLITQQQAIFDIIKIHAQQGGFCVIIGEPGVGKTVLREHIEQLDQGREFTVVSCSRTLHTYRQIVWQLAESFKLETTDKHIEKDLIQQALTCVRERKTLYILIDEAHLLDLSTLRRLRLLFDRFPKNHNLILFGQTDLMHSLSMLTNKDIKSRITYSATLQPLSDDDLQLFIFDQLKRAGMGINAFDEGALNLILRNAEGNLRLCRNLCLASLIEAARESQKIVTITHINQILIQPHWRSHEALIKQQVS